MRNRDIKSLVKLMREQGITKYSTPEVTIELGPKPNSAIPSESKGIRDAKGPTTVAEMPAGQFVTIPIGVSKERSVMDLTEEELLFWSSADTERAKNG